MKKTFVSVIFVFALTLILGLFGFSSTSAQTGEVQDHIQGQVLVKFKDSTSQDAINLEIKTHKASVVEKINKLNVLVLKVPKSQEDKIITALSHNPHVEYAEVNGLAAPFFVPNDTYFLTNQWGLENTGQVIKGTAGVLDADVDSPTAWNTTQGGVRVAVLDTGIDQDHQDLSAKVVLNKDFTTSSGVDDMYGHGTHVGGIIAAITNNSIGVAGGCPNCLLLNGKVLNDTGSGAYSWIANGIIWASDNGAKVINMSLGGSTKSKTLENAINYAWNKNVVVVAAAGNSGTQVKNYPAAYTNAIAVAATNNKDQKAPFSQYGSWVDVAAPGVNIYSTLPNHAFALQQNGYLTNYDYLSGTSMATPMTSAVAALIWSAPYGTSAVAVRSRLESTADKISGTGTYWFSGRVNAANAVAP